MAEDIRPQLRSGPLNHIACTSCCPLNLLGETKREQTKHVSTMTACKQDHQKREAPTLDEISMLAMQPGLCSDVNAATCQIPPSRDKGVASPFPLL